MLSTSRIIGIAGRKNAGKDTTGNLIMARRPRQLRRYSFAKPIKEACKAMFGWTDLELEDRILKEKVDEFWGFSPRQAMQKLGTEYGRGMLRDDVWLLAAAKFHKNSLVMDTGTLITDVRFENEADWIRSSGGVIVHVYDLSSTLQIPEHKSEVGIVAKDEDICIVNDKNKGLSNLNLELDAIWN